MTTAAKRWQQRMAGETDPPPAVEHFESCTRDAYGRAVLFFRPLGSLHLDELDAYASGLQNGTVHETGYKCVCLSLQIASVESQLTTARRVFNKHLTDENAKRVTDLEARRDRLREAE